MNTKRTFKFLTKIALLLMLVCTCFAAAGCESATKRANTQSTWSRIKRNKKVTLGIDETFVPMGYQNKRGKIVGYDLDLARAVFKPMGIKVDVQPIDWEMNTTELRNRTIDLIWNGFSATPQRAKTCAFSRPYMNGGYSILTMKKDNINKMKDLKNQKVGVQGGSSEQQAINQKPKALKDFIYNKKPVLYQSYNDAFSDLKAGRIKGIFIDSLNANYMISHDDDPTAFKEFPAPFPSTPDVVGIRKGDKKLRKIINKRLKDLQKSGKLAKINRKWFGPKYAKNQLPLQMK